MLLLIHFCKRFVGQGEYNTKYGKATNSFLLWTGCFSNFCANCLFKNKYTNAFINESSMKKMFL